MKHYFKLITISFILTLFMGFSLLAQNSSAISPDIISATRDGSAFDLAEYFNDNIELVIPQESGVFSRSQAEMVLKDFFVQNPPDNFEIIHEGSRQSASFAIGNYTSGNSVYRIYFLTKTVDGNSLIHQLRIEK